MLLRAPLDDWVRVFSAAVMAEPAVETGSSFRRHVRDDAEEAAGEEVSRPGIAEQYVAGGVSKSSPALVVHVVLSGRRATLRRTAARRTSVH